MTDPATILEEAADYLLIHGVERKGDYGDHGGPRCAIGAISSASGWDEVNDWRCLNPGRLRQDPAVAALAAHLNSETNYVVGAIANWNDSSADDFEVIDTLRHVAKDLRNGELG